LAALAGCSNDSAQVNITKPVGMEGGTVSQMDGTSVQIPMGALAMSANISITAVNVAAPVGTVLVGPAYDFGPEGTTFSSPVTITLPFDNSKIPMGKSTTDIRIYTAPRGSTEYTTVSTTVAGSTVKTATTHFTVYLPAVALPTDMAGVTGPTDLATTGVCTPGCSVVSGTGGCGGGCGATCNGHTYSMSCSQGSGGAISCFCEIDNVTQATPITLSTCSDSQAQQAFMTMCLPN
jgi:hypothetical protein